MSDVRRILRLREVDASDARSAGSKAAVLGSLLRDGFPVPDGFVLTAAADNELSGEVAAQIVAAARALAVSSFAVRSSGVSEDLSDRSFAGLYTTVLDVRGDRDLLMAVEAVLASARTTTVRTYADDGLSPAMAVLVQQMVPAEAAGVAFSANPVTGDRAEVVVNAVRGVAQSMTSGESSPDEWVVGGSVAVCRGGTWNAIDATQAQSIAALAKRVERHHGTPQDIEWAIAGDELFLLQARPITALPPAAVPIPTDAPPGYWVRHDYLPEPLFPIDREFPPMLTEGTRRMCTEFGLLFEALDCREIGGWCYRRVVPLGGKDRPAPPDWLIWPMIRLLPSLRARVRRCVEAVRDDRSARAIDQWYQVWRSQFEQRIQAIQAINLTTATDNELAQHLSAVRRLMADGLNVHFFLVGAQSIPLWELAFACRDLLGWHTAQTYDLLAGLSTASTEPSRRLADLARLAVSRPRVRTLLGAADDTTPDALAEADPEFAAAFENYQRRYASRSLRFEIAGPTLAEQPTITLRLINDIVSGGYDPDVDQRALSDRRAEATDAARFALSTQPDRLAGFDRLLERAQRAYAVRDDNIILTGSAPTALMRYAVQETGRRLAAAGRIAADEEVFFLELDEVQTALLSQQCDLHAVATQRQGEREWVKAHPGPPSHGQDPGPPPSFAAFPEEVRRSMEAALWSLDQVLAANTPAPDHGTEVVHGLGASRGRYQGPVRVILSEDEFDKLRPGDVLVCPMTSPVWSVLFSNVGALVTDTGGLLSHPAIIAREYRIPAVVATSHATRVLVDGQMVVVDGSAGTVEAAP